MQKDEFQRMFPGLPGPADKVSRHKLRLCIASPEFIGPIRNGGIGTAYTAMAHALAAAGHNVTLLYTQGSRCESATIAHWEGFYKERGLRFVARPSSPRLRIDAPAHVLRSYESYLWLRDQQFALIHFPEWGGDAYYSLQAKHQGLAFSRTLFCLGTHSPTAWLKQANSEYYSHPQDLELDFMERRSVALADIVVSPCQYMFQWMLDQGFQLPARSYMQQNILPSNALNSGVPGYGGARHAISELVFFGRLETRKGIELFCDAIDRLTSNGQLKGVAITFLGKPAAVNGTDSRIYIRQRAAKWNVKWSIISDHDQPAAMGYLKQPGRLAIIPSLIENSPYTVLECLGGGLPFLASRVGGIPELVAPDDVAASTFLPTPADLAAQLDRTLKSGARPWKPAIDPAANQAEWVEWHAALAAETTGPALSSPSLQPGTCRHGALAATGPGTAAKPLVSVCVAHFNRPHFLKQALASLEAQDYPNFEVIVVDDGSTTPEAVKYLQELEISFQRRNWRVVRQENRYLSAARNTGSRNARGDYLLFMDDDNFANPDELSTFIGVALHTGADVVTCCMNYFQGQEPPDLQPKTQTRWVPLGAAAAAGYFRNCFGDANCLVKKSVFEKLGGFTEVYGVTHEDWEFLANAVLKGFHLEVIPEALFHYRYTPNSMIRSTSQYRNHLRHIRPYLELVPPELHQILLTAQGSWIRQSNSQGPEEVFASLSLKWKSKCEAGRTLEKLGHKQAAVELLKAALKEAETTDHPLVLLEALLEIGRAFLSLETARGREMLQIAIRLGETVKRPRAVEAAKHALEEWAARTPEQLPARATSTPVAKVSSLPCPEAVVSIVIPTFNRIELTRACLRAVQEHTPVKLYEVLVVDNGSTDGTCQLLKEEQQAGRLKALFNETNVGFSRACNQGAALSRSKYVLFLNNDTLVKPGWLEPLIRIAAMDPRVGAVGSKLLFPDGRIQHAGVALIDDRKNLDPLLARHLFHGAPGDHPEANRLTLYQALTAACLLVPRELFCELGGFDEQYWNGYEDVDLCLQIGTAGKLLVYQPESVVTHLESQSGAERFQKVSQNITRLHQKWLSRARPDFVIGTDGQFTKGESGQISLYSPPTQRGGESPCVASIIVLAFNQVAHTRKCLESIAANTDVPHEVILVDNASTDSTPGFFKEWQAQHPNCKIIRNSANRGFAVGNNQAISLARGDFIVLLNNDTVVTRDWLGSLLRVAQGHPRTGIVGPMSNNVSGPQKVEGANYQSLAELPAFVAKWSEAHQGQSFEIPRAVGFCWLVTRALVERVGGLDERFGLGNFEDDDFCIRAKLAGFEIRIAKGAFVHHTGNQTFKGAGIDYRKSLLGNWEIFRTKWRLPAETCLENGYRVPTQLPDGVPLKFGIQPLNLTHQPDGLNYWSDEPSAGARVSKPAQVPSVAKVGELNAARNYLKHKDPAAAWCAALVAIESRPFHPEAFLLLAELASQAGDSVSARCCAQHARDLAPAWRAPKVFLQRNLKGNTRPGWLIVPEPARHSESKSRTKGSPRLTVCVIAKDEQQFLGRCLDSVKRLAHQIVVVDTGSTDRTVEIAKQAGAEVYQFTWCDDFSAARNCALEHARGDWILMLDADEELPPEQSAHLQTDLQKSKEIACRLPLVNKGQESEGASYVPRLFRNAPGVYYTGRIHEQVFPSLIALGKSWGLGTGLGATQILHHGYSKEVTQARNKVDRNLRLLRQGVDELPQDPNLVMNLGLELVRSGAVEPGLEQYRRAFALLGANSAGETAPELREALLTQFTCHLHKAGAHREVVSVLESPLARKAGLTASLHFALGLAQFELGEPRAAAEQFRQCLAKCQQRTLAPINTDILTAAPHHCLALSLARTGELAEAEKAFQAGLLLAGSEALKVDYAKFLAEQKRPLDALHRLHETVTENSQHIAAWRLGGQIALSAPEFLEFAFDWTLEAVRQLPNDRLVLAQHAQALMLTQKTGAARELWERVWRSENGPEALAAMILCELSGGVAVSVPPREAEAVAVTRAFIEWYRKCISARAQDVIEAVNERIEDLRACLPIAAEMVETAWAEVKASSEAAGEPCLA